MGMCKGMCRVLTITAIAGGAALVIAGPERLQMLAGQARDFVHARIDGAIDDPVKLRAQLRSLESQYPERIAEVRGELASLGEQIAELERERDISSRVVELASDDLDELEVLLTAAEDARSAGNDGFIRVRFDGASIPLDDAYAQATRLTGTVQLYRDRAEGAGRDLALLADQRTRLSELLSELETERAQFQAQLAQLEGQIEMIARNESLIGILEDRQATIDELEDFKVGSLDHVSSRMNRIRAEQESRLADLTREDRTTDYEAQAQAMLDAENVSRDVYERVREDIKHSAPRVLEITPEDVPADLEPVAADR